MKTRKFVKRTLIALACLLVLFVAFILNETKDEINADFTNIDGVIRKMEKNERLAGFAVSVFTKDTVLFKSAYGFSDVENESPYTVETRQYIASISKTTIGLALMKAQELGILNINDAVNDYLPFDLSNPNFPESEITIGQLATHTSSLDYNENVVESLYVSESQKDHSLKPFIESYFKDLKYGPVTFMDSKPGEIFNYSNIGAGLAAYLIELKSGMTFDKFTKMHVFDPLGLLQTSWFLQSEDSLKFSNYYELQDSILVKTDSKGVVLFPARDLITNVNDLTTYCQAIMSRSPKLLSDESYDLLLSPLLKSSVENAVVDNSGLFWMIDRNQYGVVYQLTGMNGGDSNINTMMQFDASTGLGYIFIGNTGQSPQNRINHIVIFNALVSLGDHYIMANPKTGFSEKVAHKWYNIYSRFRALF